MKRALIFLTVCFFAQLAHFANGQAAIKAITTMHSDGSYTETVIDMDSRIETDKTFDAGKKLMNKVIYRLDQQGQRVSAFVYNQIGKLTGKTLYKRDQANVVTEQIDYTPNDKMIRRIFFNYDAKGHVVSTRVAGPVAEPSATAQPVQAASPAGQASGPTVEIQGGQPTQIRRAEPVRQ